MRRILTFTGTCLLLLAPGLRAEEWAIVGARQMGMGGAGVALTRGALGAYWNPAALAPPAAADDFATWDVAVPASAQVAAVGNVLADVDDIVDLVDDLGDFDDLADSLDDPGDLLGGDDLGRIIRLVSEEIDDLGGDGDGLVASASVGAAARIGYFGLSVLGLSSAGGVTNVDLTNLALGDEGIGGAIGAGNDRSAELSAAGQSFADRLASLGVADQNQAEEVVFQAERAGVPIDDPTVQSNIENLLEVTQDNIGGDLDRFFTQNGSGVDLRGIIVQEYGVSFGYPFFELFSVGVTAKLMHGTTYYKPYTLATVESIDDLLDELLDESDGRDESLGYGVDVGVLVEPLEGLSLGVVGRNLNRPAFDFEGPGDYVLEPQVRAGVGFVIPGTGVALAVDADLLENDSDALPGYESQTVGGGVEVALLESVALRGGLSKNIAEPAESFVIHAGAGFAVSMVSIEIAGSLSPEFTEVDGNDIPERAGASLFVGINVPLD